MKHALNSLKANLDYFEIESIKIQVINNKKKQIISGIKEVVSYNNLLN